MNDRKGLDVLIPVRQLYKALTNDGYSCLVFEKHYSTPLEFPEDAPFGDYVLCINAMDADMETDEHTVIGTYFSVYKRTSPPSTPGKRTDLTQTLSKQVAAGFVVYSSAVSLYYTVGQGVYNFVLNPVARQYFLSRQSIDALSLPTGCNNVYTNTNLLRTEKAFKEAVKKVTMEATPRGSTFDLNAFTPSFYGALKSGALIVLFEVDLLCEAGPAAMLMEQMGGKATDGRGGRILDSSIADEPHNNELHAKTTFVAGPRALVDALETQVREIENVNGTNAMAGSGSRAKEQ